MTDTNQKLREALPPLHTGCLPTLNQDPYPALGDWWVQLWDGSGDDAKVIVRVYGNSPEQAKQRAEAMCQALALPTADHIPDAGEMVVDHLPDAGKMIETAAPDMPLSMNQFGRLVELTREHLTDNTFVYKATSKAGDTCHFGVESAAKAWAKGGTVEAIKVREFKLHTSSPTAAPVGDLPELPEAYGYFDIRGSAADGYTADQMRAYARAALRSGDAVDAQMYRWLMDNCTLGIKQNGVGWSLNTTACIAPDCIKDVGATIDAAMRKGQL